MFLAMAEDIRVVLIKLADRLHNMRTLGALPPEKQQRIARQTMEIYAPLAERLGIWQIKWELEDLAFKVLEPERVPRAGQARSTRRRKGREAYVERAIADAAPTRSRRPASRPSSQGRPKHIYSICKKMQRKGAELRRDLRRPRDPRPRRRGPGLLRRARRRPLPCGGPIPGQFDDYIAMPKNNLLPEPPHRGHRARRQAARGPDPDPRDAPGQRGRHRRPLALQGGRPKADRDYDAKLAWLRQLMDWQREVSDATEFVEGVKLDIFQDQVFVFTPKGDVKDLPAGATPLDFAYRIHTDVGHR